jgi:hypothetical protein
VKRTLLALLAALVLFGCPSLTPDPVAPTPDGGTGGQAATGGSSSVADAGPLPCVEPAEQPTANPAVLSDARQAVSHKLSGRNSGAPDRADPTPPATTPCFPWQSAPVTPLTQRDGSCTGNSGIGMIASAPFNDLTFYHETYALEAYQGGTCLDRGCAIPCTSKTCPTAYNPATGANDTGSYGSSVLTWMIKMGLLGGYTTADTVDQLLAGLTRSTCIIGVDFYDSMYTPNVDGRLTFSTKVKPAGGHEMLATRYDPALDGVWVRTSWGPVWWCLKSQVNKQTPIDGTGCGYAWIARADLTKLHFDGNCPKVTTL